MVRPSLALLLVLLSAQCALGALPTGFSLTSYSLTLTAGSATTTATTATGSMVIVLTCTTAVTTGTTTTINLNWGSNLTPTAPTATDITFASSATTAPTFTIGTVVAEILTITTTSAFAAAETLTITIAYTTTLTKDNVALFYRQYTNDDNTTSTFIAANMWPSYARSVFPCFDDPSITAPFTLTVVRPTAWATGASSFTGPTTTAGTTTSSDAYTAATMPVNAITFFTSSDMVKTSYTSTRSSTALTFWTRKGYTTGATYQNNLDFLASYFYDVEDFLTTLLPRTAGLNVVLVRNLEKPFAGYGVIYIRDEDYQLDYSTAWSEGLFKQNVVPVVHEYIRQYTEFSTRPTNWTDSWMSDAMAGFLQTALLTAKGLPFDFRSDVDVIARQTALAVDFPTSNVLQFTDTLSTTNALVERLQDDLRTYKGRFLLSMLDSALPAGSVLAAILNVLKYQKETTYTASSLITQITTNATNDGGYVSTGTTTFMTNMINWFNTAGYPLITLSAITAGTPGTTTLTMGVYCDTAVASCTNTLPTYSLAASVGSQTETRYYTLRQGIWVSNTATATASLSINSTDWVVANMRSSGYYRATYPNATWTLIETALKAADDQIQGRTQLIDDAFSLGLTNNIDLTIPLTLAVANTGETLFRNWFPVYLGLNQIRDRLYGLSDYSFFTSYASPLLTDVNAIISNGTLNSFEAAKVSSMFFDWMCELNIGNYRTYSANNLTTLLAGGLPTTVPTSSYESMVCCGARYGSQTASTLWATLITSTSSYYTRRFNAIAIGCLSNYTDISSIYTTVLAADKELKPHVITMFDYIAEYHPDYLIANLSTIAVSLQTMVGAPAVTNFIYRAATKTNTNVTALAAVSTLAVDPIVTAAVTAVTTSVTTRTTWLTTYQTTLTAALTSTKLATSGATTIYMFSLTLLIPALLLVKTNSV